MRLVPLRRSLVPALGALLVLGVLAAPADAQRSRFHVLREAPANAVPPPDFRYPDLAGKPRHLRDYQGKVVLLAFFATWCPMCDKEMPKFSAVQKKYGGADFTVLAVSVDSAGASLVERWARRKGLNYPVLHDKGWTSRRTHNVRFVPTAYLIDREQRLAAWGVGVVDWSGPRASGMIRRLLRGEAAAPAPAADPQAAGSSP